jgi:hypothetical protein
LAHVGRLGNMVGRRFPMTRYATTGLLTLALTAAGTLGQPGKDPLKTVSYSELGQMVRGLKGKVGVVYFWADY